MSDQNWRTEVNAGDYFGNQRKKLQFADRRPVIRRPSDLVGPGIADTAVRLDDYNDLLATYNGFFSSAISALNAPNSTDAFVGTVVSDSLLGGVQRFTSLASSVTYTRTFNRSPLDPATIYWGAWA